MSQLSHNGRSIREDLNLNGIDSTISYERNRLPTWAIPRTLPYNLYTFAVGGLSLAGLVYARRRGLFYQGFAIAFGLTIFFDFVQRRQLDQPSFTSYTSSPSFETLIERFPEFKKAYETVDAELDAKIAQLQGYTTPQRNI